MSVTYLMLDISEFTNSRSADLVVGRSWEAWCGCVGPRSQGRPRLSRPGRRLAIPGRPRSPCWTRCLSRQSSGSWWWRSCSHRVLQQDLGLVPVWGRGVSLGSTYLQHCAGRGSWWCSPPQAPPRWRPGSWCCRAHSCSERFGPGSGNNNTVRIRLK